MPTIETTVTCPVHDSFRVQQVGGMFDVPLQERSSETFCATIPSPEESWSIGLIVGPSGSGKSTIARQAFGSEADDASPGCSIDTSTEWPRDRAVIDCFDEQLSTKAITRLLTSVGFSSPPSWLKPYHVLSGGERFRCDLARSLSRGLMDRDNTRSDDDALDNTDSHSSGDPIVVFDEFTSVVDRTVAQVGSAAVSKAIRRRHLHCRFVAVTCHYDVADWLEPDWVVDMADGAISWRCLRRPKLELQVHRCQRSAWPLFARHHYLSGSLSVAARCFVAVWNNRPVAFAATLPMIGHRGHWRISRLVALPDFQGIGVGMQLAVAVAQIHREEGHRLSVTASHPSLISHCQRSDDWRTRRIMKTGSRSHRVRNTTYCGSPRRAVVSFEYVGSA